MTGTRRPQNTPRSLSVPTRPTAALGCWMLWQGALRPLRTPSKNSMALKESSLKARLAWLFGIITKVCTKGEKAGFQCKPPAAPGARRWLEKVPVPLLGGAHTRNSDGHACRNAGSQIIRPAPLIEHPNGFQRTRAALQVWWHSSGHPRHPVPQHTEDADTPI